MANIGTPYIANPEDPHASPPDARPVKGPFAVPTRASGTLYWNYDAMPRLYLPFIVRVLELSGDDITFEILRHEILGGETEASPISDPITEKLYNGHRIWNKAPSTAQLVKNPADKSANCGFLFMTTEYISLLGKQGYVDPAAMASYDSGGKWPKSTSSSAMMMARLHWAVANGEELSTEFHRALLREFATLP